VIHACTPGFWSGGSGGTLWNVANDPDWTASGGMYAQPYTWSTTFFGGSLFQRGKVPTNEISNTVTMIQLAGTGGGKIAAQKAARSVVAAYLSASYNSAYPLTREEILAKWNYAANLTNKAQRNAAFMALATELGVLNTEFDCRF
jgi:hypothetical protein